MWSFIWGNSWFNKTIKFSAAIEPVQSIITSVQHLDAMNQNLREWYHCCCCCNCLTLISNPQYQFCRKLWSVKIFIFHLSNLNLTLQFSTQTPIIAANLKHDVLYHHVCVMTTLTRWYRWYSVTRSRSHCTPEEDGPGPDHRDVTERSERSHDPGVTAQVTR